MSALSVANRVVTLESAAGAALVGRVCRSMPQRSMTEALDELFDGLDRLRQTMEPDEWLAFASRVRSEGTLSELLYQDPLTRRAFEKPRGYAGDAVMMDYIYGIHGAHEAFTAATSVGRQVFDYLRSRPAPRSVCNRREHLADRRAPIADTSSRSPTGTSFIATSTT